MDKTGEIGGRRRNCLVGGQNGRRAAEYEMGEQFPWEEEEEEKEGEQGTIFGLVAATEEEEKEAV